MLLLNNFETYHTKIFSFLVVLLPLASITGPAVPDMIISIIGFYFILASFFERKFYYYKNLFVYLFLLFCAYLILRSLFSSYPILSMQIEGSVFYFRYLFFVLGIWYLYERNDKLLIWLSYSIIIFVSIVCLDGYLQFFTGKNIFGWSYHWGGMRLSSFFGEELILGSYITKYGAIGFSLFLLAKKPNVKMYMLLMLFLMIVEILAFLSGERSAFFHITLFTICVIFLSKKFRIIRLISFLISFLIILFFLNTNTSVQERNMTTIDQVSNVKLKYLPYSPAHEKIYISSLKMFRDNPLFGKGTALFRIICYEKEYYIDNKPECHSQPHNMYIQLLAENGILGISFLLIFYFYLSKKLFLHFLSLFFITKKKWFIKDELLFIYIFLFVVWWPLIPHQSFFNNWTNVMLFLPLGFLFKHLFSTQIKP